jgi:hypothetical protein
LPVLSESLAREQKFACGHDSLRLNVSEQNGPNQWAPILPGSSEAHCSWFSDASVTGLFQPVTELLDGIVLEVCPA